ncbi:MAG: phage/plasmid replication protein [Sulfuricellaceae bacterium]
MNTNPLVFDSVFCDWMSLRHDYPIDRPGKALESGRIIKIDRDGVIEFDKGTWDQIQCVSSDTSVRVKCDGLHLWMTGNIGRFQQPDNFLGHPVIECVEKFADMITVLGLDPHMFGTRMRLGSVSESGTHLTRLDLTGNFYVSDYPALLSATSVRRIGQKLPMMGKYGPTWGYDTKRSNWLKAKIYDKTAEMEGRRVYSRGATNARMEVQLGSEYLKRHHLDQVENWKEGNNMENVIYGKFAEQVFRESVSAEDWSEIPDRMRHHAILWRDGVDIRSQLSKAAFYKARKKLLEYGIDIGTPCNVIAFTRQVKVVEIIPLNGLRSAA